MKQLTSKNNETQAVYDILIIDDSKFIIKLLTEIITLRGYTCKAVGNFPNAMKELNSAKPKLIFLDVNMPDLNGYKFCKMIKSEEKFNNILVYYLTGVPLAEISVKTLETKADGFITKPFNLLDFNDIFEHLKQEKE